MTKTNTHTPGPLVASDQAGTHGFGIYPNDGHALGHAYKEADAILWAAAPELLAELEGLYRVWLGVMHFHEDKQAANTRFTNVRQAILKAGGEC